jgi:O-antigen/teichoic acid export membrane protein
MTSGNASPSLGRASVRGAAWIAAAGIASKFVSVAVQFALGWLLGEGDFAIYGTAISLTVFTSALTDGGVQKLLRQQPHRYSELVGSAVAVSAVSAALGAAILMAFAFASPKLYGTESIKPLVLVLVANVPVTAAVAFMRTRLHIDLRFRAIAIKDAATVFAQGGLTVLLAWSGLGALSFVLPLLAINASEAVVLALIGGARGFNLGGVTVASVRAIVRSSSWIMLASACGVLVLRGDYFAMGLVAESMLGYYFFGFQLAASTMTLLTSGAYGVLLPALSRVASDPARLRAAFERAIRLAAFLIAPGGVFVAIAGPAAVHLLWTGRWDEAIPVVQAVALSASMRGLAVVSGAGVEAAGRWRLRAGIEAIDGVSLIATILAAVWLGGSLSQVAIAVGLQRIVAGAMHLSAASAAVGSGVFSAVRWYGPFLLPALAAFGLAEWIGGSMRLPAESLSGAAVRLAAFAAMWAPVVAFWGRRELGELRAIRSAG